MKYKDSRQSLKDMSYNVGMELCSSSTSRRLLTYKLEWFQ